MFWEAAGQDAKPAHIATAQIAIVAAKEGDLLCVLRCIGETRNVPKNRASLHGLRVSLR
jgi:hypothetical protein